MESLWPRMSLESCLHGNRLQSKLSSASHFDCLSKAVVIMLDGPWIVT